MTNHHSPSAAYWVEALALSPHPEGGFFKETYRSPDTIPAHTFPERFSGARNACTSIFYLLEQGDFSAFHRIRSDEIWHFYDGGPLELHILQNGIHQTVWIGRDIGAGHHLQYVVPAGAWFASTPSPDTTFSLVGCTVSPGFDFADFEIAKRAALLEGYPHVTETITRLTRL